ncbi:hypothetical protein ACFOX0_03595 [Micromonospora zhanjiangensis]|uniref:Uncharacterized protein n=1 Tax=Micromonospora zhanjiangensis TaxID=1522057 RepID=A0ABV8KG88_9ACTN
MTLFGWDTSDYDVGRGLTRARVTDAAGLGITFLTCKGTEQSPSAVFRSQHCGWILATARDARIPFLGMYVVVRSGVPAATQAGTLVSYANSQVPWWSAFPGFFWQVDLERWPYDQVSPSVGVQVANELEARTAKTALMYASKGQYGTSPLGDFPRWNANYPYNLDENFTTAYQRAGGDTGPGWTAYGSPLTLPRIWQYTSTARIGAQRTCDANAFRGTAADFATMIGTSAPGELDVKAANLVTAARGFTIPTDGAFHNLRWSDGNYAYSLPGSGYVAHQVKLDLRGLLPGDLVRIEAVYEYPGNPAPYRQLLAQLTVSVDPANYGGQFVVASPNENHQMVAGTSITFAAAVTAGAGNPARTLTFGGATRKSVLLFA